jgi:hypothetical protein
VDALTLFLVAIPTADRDLPASPDSPDRMRDRLARVAAGFAPLLGPDYEPTPAIEDPAQGRAAVLTWRRRGDAGVALAQGDHWSVTAGSAVDADLRASVRRRAGRLVYDRPVWGQYATVWGERYADRVTAWNTVPALEAIHWGEAGGYVFVSNRPLLVALGAVAGARSAVQLSTDYLTEYLLYGYSVRGQTPFAGVHTIPVNRALQVHRGRAGLVDIPAGLEGPLPVEHTAEDGVDALAGALTSAMDRTLNDLQGRPLQLRMSGGKDSRLLLGLLRERDVDVQAVTFGRSTDPDVRLAQWLTEGTNTPHSHRLPDLAPAETLCGQVALTIAAGGGIPASEPHTARYRAADPQRPGEAIMLGQWPLTKGGMAKRMRYPQGAIWATVRKQGGALLNQGAREEADAWLHQWFTDVPAVNDLEKLYLFAREFRSGRYLHAHIAQFSGEAKIAYPISDAEVAAVCDALTMGEKVSERALFGALERVWPDVMAVPLDRSVWRFESGGPDPDYSGPHYEARSTPLPEVAAEPEAVDRPSEFSTKLTVQLAREITASDRRDLFASLLDAPVWEALRTAASRGEVVVPEGMVRMELVKYFWRVYVADIWLSRQWLPA